MMWHVCAAKQGGVEEEDVDNNPLIGSRNTYQSQHNALKERYKTYLQATMKAQVKE